MLKIIYRIKCKRCGAIAAHDFSIAKKLVSSLHRYRHHEKWRHSSGRRNQLKLGPSSLIEKIKVKLQSTNLFLVIKS
jgi:hypothetical protein